VVGNVLVGVGAVLFAAAIGVAYWYYLLLKIEKAERDQKS
jgi:hypothetical protein